MVWKTEGLEDWNQYELMGCGVDDIQTRSTVKTRDTPHTPHTFVNRQTPSQTIQQRR